VSNERAGYMSYLLRLRRSHGDRQPAWRASLESTRDGQRQDFDSVDALIAYLRDRFGQKEGSDEKANGG
jgi:hypothetical protein